MSFSRGKGPFHDLGSWPGSPTLGRGRSRYLSKPNVLVRLTNLRSTIAICNGLEVASIILL